jgi:hypothetical protein
VVVIWVGLFLLSAFVVGAVLFAEALIDASRRVSSIVDELSDPTGNSPDLPDQPPHEPPLHIVGDDQ